MTRADGNEKSISIPNASRLKSSITLNSRILRPSFNWSCIKSIAHTAFTDAGTTRLPYVPLARLQEISSRRCAMEEVMLVGIDLDKHVSRSFRPRRVPRHWRYAGESSTAFPPRPKLLTAFAPPVRSTGRRECWRQE
jgi:hypothetical protein